MLEMIDELHEKGDFKETLELIEIILKENPNEIDALIMKATIWLDQGRNEEADRLMIKTNEMMKADLLNDMNSIPKDDPLYPLFKSHLSSIEETIAYCKKKLEKPKTFTIPIKIVRLGKVNVEKINEEGNYVSRTTMDPPWPTSSAPKIFEKGIISHPYLENLYEESKISDSITLSCELISWVYDPYDVRAVKFVSRDGFPWLYELVFRLYFNNKVPSIHELVFDGTILHLEQSLNPPDNLSQRFLMRFNEIHLFIEQWIEENKNPQILTQDQINFLTSEIKKVDEKKRIDLINRESHTSFDVGIERTIEEYIKNVNNQLRKFGIKNVELYSMHQYNTEYGLDMTDFFYNTNQICKGLTTFEAKSRSSINKTLEDLFALDLPLLSKDQKNAEKCNELWKELVRQEVDASNIGIWDINLKFII